MFDLIAKGRCVLTPSVLFLLLLVSPGLAGSQDMGAKGRPGHTSSAWMKDVVRQVEESEYHVSWRPEAPIPGFDGGYTAPNRAQNLRIGFSEDRVLISSRVSPSWVLQLRASGTRSGDRTVELGSVMPSVSDNEVMYNHLGLTQILSNRPEGVGLSFRIDAAPVSARELSVMLELVGDLDHRIVRGSVVELMQEGEAVLRLGPVAAFDALGVDLPVSLARARSGVVELVIGVDHAVFPISLEGSLKSISTSPDFGMHEGVDYDNLGSSIATAGDVNGDGYSDVIVGIPGFDNGSGADRGKVQVYHGGSGGLGSPAAKSWTAEGPAVGSRFGESVATAGDIDGDGYSDIVIGLPGWAGVSGESNGGGAFVYHGSSTGLSTSVDWILQGNQEHAFLGFCVATAGDVNGDGYSDVIVSEPFFDTGVSDAGRVTVYHGGVGGLGTSLGFLATGTQAYEEFGLSASTAGDVNGDGYADVLIASPTKDHSTFTDSGEVRLYPGSSTGVKPAVFTAITQDVADLRLGRDVSTAGDVNGDGYADCIIGAEGSANGEGAAFLYRGGATGLDTFYTWRADGVGYSDSLGIDVATAGDVNGDGYADIIVGAIGAGSGNGQAYVWVGGGGGLGPNGTAANAYWTGDADPTDGYVYGVAVATAGDVNGDGYSDILVSDPLFGTDFEGAVYGYYGGPDNLADSPAWWFDSGQQIAQLGISVAPAGDVNGDGYGDFIVGAEYYDYSFTNEGAAFVWYGDPAGPGWAGADWNVYGGRNDARLGHSVGTAGDVNGDGYSDVIVGAPDWTNGNTDEGAAFVFHGGASGLVGTSTATAAWKAEIDDYQAQLGWSVGTAGDVNGDGYADVVVGAPGAGASYQGRALVWHGSATGLGADGTLANSDWDWAGSTANGRFGQSVGTAGDVNRDYVSDLIVGGDEVAVVWHGSSTGLSPTTFDWSYASSAFDDNDLGWSVGTAGDTSGDGYSDVVVGAPKMDSDIFTTDDGAMLVFCGGISGLGAGPCFTDYGYADDTLLGSSVATAGDLNGDGFSDLVAGARHWTSGQSWEGQARVYYGSIFGLWAADWTHENNQAQTYLGAAVGTAGDINGDGYADLLIGAPGFESTYPGEGRVSLFYGNGEHGNGAGGRSRLTQQLTPGSLPIAPQGRSTSEDVIRFYHRQPSPPTGRGRVWVETEVNISGENFTGINTLPTTGYDTGTGGAAFLQDRNALVSGFKHHWRARVIHSPVTNPFDPPRGPWFHLATFGMNEAHMQAAGDPFPQQDEIFSDGFESGNFSAWSSVNQ